MDQKVLVGPDIQAGRDFLELLESAGVPVTAALWMRDGTPKDWQFHLITPWVDRYGVRQTFRKISAILSKASPPPAIDLLDVYIYAEKSSHLDLLRKEFRRARDQVFHNQRIDSGYDSGYGSGYIYAVK